MPTYFMGLLLLWKREVVEQHHPFTTFLRSIPNAARPPLS
jgi:hypothetical protein